MNLAEACAGSGEERLRSLLREWDAAANGARTPENTGVSCKAKVAWRCSKGHAWTAAIYARVAGSGCPYCSGRKPVAGENDLATTHPHLASEWDTEKNGDLTPRDVSAGSHRKVAWRCARGHVWTVSVNRRTYRDSGCPYCAGKLPIPGETDFATRCPEAAAEWDYEKNGDLRPEQVMPRSKGFAWWICPLGHSYRAAIRSRGGEGTGCPYCAGQAALAGFNDLATKYPRLAKEWFQPLNGELTPEGVTAGCNRRVAWRCVEGHVWFARIDSRARGDGHGCPVCAGQIKKARLAFYERIVAGAPVA